MDTPSWRAHLPPGMDPVSLDLLRGGTLPRAWARRWATDPAAPSLADFRRGPWISAAEVEERSRRVAGRFLGAGLHPGDRLLMSATNSVDLAVAHVGALRAGLVVVPANPAYREREIAHLVRDARPAGAVVDSNERADWVRAGAPDAVVVGPGVELADGDPPPGFLDAGSPGDPALLCYTSGTTGAPKGALLSHANLLSNSQSVAIAWRWTADDRLVLPLPLFHAHGLAVGLHGTLLTGASGVLLPGFDVAGVLDAAEEERASLFFGVPTMYHRLAASTRVGELARLRLCVSGSAPLPAALFQQVEAACGLAPLERYGTTETLMAVSNPYDGERRPGAVGLPFPGVEVRLGAGGGEEAGQVGEILVRGPSVFTGYLGQAEATAAALTEGWFSTGDLGCFDPDGYLRIVGRSKEVIITGGQNVYPREVEDVLSACPGVAEVAVVGVPSAEWGEVVTAVVVSSGGAGPSGADLLAYAASRLARFKVPREVRFVDALPRNALGKVVRSALRD